MEVCTDTKRSFISRLKFLRYIDRGGSSRADTERRAHVRAILRGVVRVRMRVHKSACARRKDAPKE